VPRAVTQDMRSLPLPDYDDYFEEVSQSLYGESIVPGLPMEFSRGCWWGAKSHCTFCGLNGGTMSYRAKPPEGIAEEILSMSARYGTRRIEAVDNILDMSYLDTVMLRLAEEEEQPSIFFEIKSNIKKSQLQRLAAAGVRWVQPGIESFDSRVLKLMRKGCTAAQNLQLLKWGRQYGVRVSWSLLYGFPGEEDAWYTEMAELLPLLAHLQPGASFALRYDRYSPYFTAAQQYGLKLRPCEPYRYVYPLDDASLAEQVYFFDEESGSAADVPASVRPGLHAVRRAVADWLTAWRGEQVPTLAMYEEDDVLVVEDTRACAVAPRHELDGLHRLLLEAADEAPPTVQIQARFEALGHDSDIVAAAIADLLRRRLAVQLDGRTVGLPLSKPHPRLPSSAGFPGGYFMQGKDPLTKLIGTM
jgi:ribosomal peptide maturation radical SAM protein 1